MSGPENHDPLFALFRAARTFADATYPGHHGITVHIDLPGRTAKIPVPLMAQQQPPARAAEVRWWHSPDYREVRWCGHFFRFSKTRAAVVALLDQARQEGSPDVPQSEILRAVGSEGTRLSELFREGDGKRAWGALIVQGDDPGTYRLADRPADQVA